MELTDGHIEAIREAARTVEYGSVTINISASSDKLELNVQNRIRLDKESLVTAHRPPLLAKHTGKR
jgi:hypothetical protein